MNSNFNQNFYQGKDFQLVINRLPHVQYFSNRISLPAINVADAIMPSPFTVIRVPGDQLQYSPLEVTFKVDADLKNYEEIVLWMETFGTPHSFNQYKTVSKADADTKNVKDKVSDIELILTTNKYNPNLSVMFEDAYPSSISGLNISVDNNDVVVQETTVIFSYTKYHLNRVNPY